MKVVRDAYADRSLIEFRGHDIKKIVVDDDGDIETSEVKGDGQGCRFEIGT